jgi:hypothetical protein
MVLMFQRRSWIPVRRLNGAAVEGSQPSEKVLYID